jgi:hypothetical protein
MVMAREDGLLEVVETDSAITVEIQFLEYVG